MNHVLRCHEIRKTDFVRGEGCLLFDAEGRSWLDLESGIWAAGLGHRHPRLERAMIAQVERLVHLGTRTPSPLAELAAVDVLAAVGFGEGRCVFLSSGSEAVELGLTAARRVTGRPLLVALDASFFGSYGSAGTRPPDTWRVLDRHLGADDLDRALEDVPLDRVAAFVYEPGGSGVAHVQFHDPLLVRGLAARVRAAGGLLVVNEVTSGMGRTGAWFGFQHDALEPDVVALGKGLGGGYPVSAVALRPAVADALEGGGFRYAQSHQNDPLGCAVVREVLAVMRDEGLVERGAALGAWFLDRLALLASRHPAVHDVRGRGLLLAVEVRPDAPVDVARLYAELLEMGFLVGYYPDGRILRLDPPLVVTRDQLERFVQALDGILTRFGA